MDRPSKTGSLSSGLCGTLDPSLYPSALERGVGLPQSDEFWRRVLAHATSPELEINTIGKSLCLELDLGIWFQLEYLGLHGSLAEEIRTRTEVIPGISEALEQNRNEPTNTAGCEVMRSPACGRTSLMAGHATNPFFIDEVSELDAVGKDKPDVLSFCGGYLGDAFLLDKIDRDEPLFSLCVRSSKVGPTLYSSRGPSRKSDEGDDTASDGNSNIDSPEPVAPLLSVTSEVHDLTSFLDL